MKSILTQLRHMDLTRSVIRRLPGFLMIASLTCAMGTAGAATYTVTGTGGTGGACSGVSPDYVCTTLRAAINHARAAPGDDIIVFDGNVFTDETNSRIALGGTGLLIDSAEGTLIIDGTRADGGNVIIDASNSSRVLTMYGDVDVTLRHLDLIRGNLLSLGGAVQGAVLYNGGTLLIQHGRIANGRASAGTSQGGGIYNHGSLTLEHSVVTANEAVGGGGSGGGIHNVGTMTLESSTVSGNTAGGSGGGIMNSAGTLILRNSNVSNNASSNVGGGIYNSGTLTLAHSTLLGNSGGGWAGGLVNSNGTAQLAASVIGGSNFADCYLHAGAIHATNSLIQSGLGCISGTNANNLQGDPRLDGLADNGGHVPTHLPQADSPLLDAAGDCTAQHPFDARGLARPQGMACDIGAVERGQHRLTAQVNGSGQVTADALPAPLGGSIDACAASAGLCVAGYDAEHGATPTAYLTAAPAMGWRLVGWGGDCVEDDNDPLRAEVLLDGNKACTATFVINQYTVSFDPHGGDAVSPITADYQSLVTLPATTRANHAFLAWNTAPDGSGDVHLAGANFSLPAQDTTLHAQWAADTLYLVIDASDSLTGTCNPVAPDMAECDTLRAAITTANATLADDAIAFAPDVFTSANDATIVLTEGHLVIASTVSSGSLDIDGVRGDGGNVSVSGNDSSRVLLIESGADVRLQRLDVVAGSADNGGGIRNHGALSVTHGTVSDSIAGIAGGGIDNHGLLLLSHVTVQGSQANHGGGVRNLGTFIVENSTLSGNTASLHGGGIHNAGELSLAHVTATGNHAQWGGGISFLPGSAQVRSSLLAGNTAVYGSNCYYDVSVTATDAGHNLDDGNGCGFDHATSLSNVSAELGALQDNGGPTFTHLPGPDSAAIDAAGDCGAAHPDDQRGIARPQRDACDIGAVEVRPDSIFSDGFES